MQKMLVMVPSRTKYQGGPLERQIEPEDDAGHFYQFLWKCYERFWANEDEYPEEKLALEQAFGELLFGPRRLLSIPLLMMTCTCLLQPRETTSCVKRLQN